MNSWCLNSHLQTNTQNLAKPNQTHKPKLYLKGFPHPPLEKKNKKTIHTIIHHSGWIIIMNILCQPMFWNCRPFEEHQPQPIPRFLLWSKWRPHAGMEFRGIGIKTCFDNKKKRYWNPAYQNKTWQMLEMIPCDNLLYICFFERENR